MTGTINCCSSKMMEMPKIKDLSKKLGITVNDLLVSATGAALKDYLKLAGDKVGSMPDNEAQINVMIPANIRFKLYPTKEAVKAENKFACIPMVIPLVSNMQDAYQPISKATKKLKNAFSKIYAVYAGTFW